MCAARIAIEYRTPVYLLSDTFLANSSEPWLLPKVDDLPAIDPKFATGPNHDDGFMPYLRDDRFVRPWAIPGTPGLEHRIGGLEKADGKGNVEILHYTRTREVWKSQTPMSDEELLGREGARS